MERAGISWGPLDTQEAKAIASWHANVVRVPLNEDCWLGTDGAPEGYSAAAYRNEVVNWVRAINDAGMVAILDLHWAAPGHQMATQQWPMPDADHSITFWSQVAETFLGDPSVIFDLFNEPYLGGKAPTASDWSCWLNGCTAYFQDVSYQVAGMQQLLDAVRAVGATQPVMVGGLNWAGDPCGLSDAGHDSAVCAWLTYRPVDPDHQLTVSFHTYAGTACDTVTCWDESVAAVSTRVPVITGELGESDCSAAYIDAYMQWADGHDISYPGLVLASTAAGHQLRPSQRVPDIELGRVTQRHRARWCRVAHHLATLAEP